MDALRVRPLGEHRHATVDEQRTMLEKYIEEGQGRAQAVVDQIFTRVPEDRIVRAHALLFDEDGERTGFQMGNGGPHMGLHDNALQQVASFAEIPVAYCRDLQQTEWGRRLLGRNLNDLFVNRFKTSTRFLVRSMDAEARGFLSTRYRRLDSRPIVEKMLEVVREQGAVVIDGYAGDVRVNLRAIHTRLVETQPGEVAVFGLNFTNSDYGRGALEMSSFLLRVWCTNAATMEDALRKIHLGARLSDDLEFSQRTYELDTEAMASAVKDLTSHLLSDGRCDEIAARVRAAAAEKADVKQALAEVRGLLSKGEASAIEEAYNGPDVVLLPEGNTRWRFSNAISLVARQQQDGDRRIDLEALAGKVLQAA